MFTGIVEEVGRVSLVPPGGLMVTAGDVLQEMHLGDSMAVNGVCLTITELTGNAFAVDVMPETLKRTNLGRLHPGDGVNLERPLALGGRMGGHLVQGHVDDVGRVVSVTPEGAAKLVRIEAPAGLMGYIVTKGFIAVDGISLTVVDVEPRSFRVSLVGYTQQHTTLADRQIGDLVNLEVDIIAKYVERLTQPHRPGITADLLNEHGFTVN
ncbi:MAG: riboflavin synthase [Chloroflexota bacterium]